MKLSFLFVLLFTLLNRLINTLRLDTLLLQNPLEECLDLAHTLGIQSICDLCFLCCKLVDDGLEFFILL